MGGRNEIRYLKSRKTFSFMGLVPSKMAKMPKSGVFGAQRNVSDDVGGIRPPKNFIFEIRLVRYLGDPFAKLRILGRPTAPYNTILRKNVPCKNELLGAKNCN